MSKYVTEDDVAFGYASEPDEYDSENVRDIILAAEPAEIYVGNTGEVSASKFFKDFKYYGYITDMHLWRSHNHLYHARICYRTLPQAQKAIEEKDGKIYNGKRLRVSLVGQRSKIDYPAAIRIDDICEGCPEEEIYEHFSCCGPIKFVINTGCAAYIHFESAKAASLALQQEKILNGDPYTIARIFGDDRMDHVQVLENMKDIKYRKPFVMVENFPQLPKGTPLSQYKANFASIGPVRHFKIAPTKDNTVTLALCMEKADDREMAIERFNDTMVKGKQLKLYMAPGKARMTIDHAATFASCKSTIVVDGIPPYYKDYDVCRMFRRCGEINFAERFNTKWMICFEGSPAVSLAHFYHFIINKQRLVIQNLTPGSLPIKTTVSLLDYEAPKEKVEEIKPKWVPNSGRADDFLRASMRAIDAKVKATVKAPIKTPVVDTAGPKTITDSISKTKTLSAQAKQIATMFKQQQQGSIDVVKATPVQEVPPVAQKRPAGGVGQKQSLPTFGGRTRNDSQSSNSAVVVNNEEKETETGYAVHLGNLPKGLEESDLRDLFKGHMIKSVVLRCAKDSYHPTAEAYVCFNTKDSFNKAIENHHNRYRGKRVMITKNNVTQFFKPETSVIIKNLTPNVDAEGVLDEVEKVLGAGKVQDVLKPAHHYAYVDFSNGLEAKVLINHLRDAFTRYKIDVFPLYRMMPKRSMHYKPHFNRTLEEMRALYLLLSPSQVTFKDKHFGVHNAHKLFVGNIPRDTNAEDIIDYFNNFGKVIDYKPIEKKSCYLRKSVILSFENSKHAENAYTRYGHYFEGSQLDVHLMDMPPYHFEPRALVLTAKFHSPFLTVDEIRNAVRKHVMILYTLRFDAYDDRANLVIRYTPKKSEESFKEVQQISKINDEAVLFVEGVDLNPPEPDEARESANISKSPFRKYKGSYLSFAVYKENLKEDLEIRTRTNSEQNVPLKAFYNDNSVQINNVAVDTSLEDLRDLLMKCGNITDYQALILEEDATKICYVKFDTDLAADLACTYNQRMLDGKRLLIHLVKETVNVERDRSIFVERLNPRTTAEQLYDAFSPIGVIKYVQKQSPFTAIVCFKDQDSMIEAVNVSDIPNSGAFIINPCYEDYDSRFYNNFCVKEEFISIERIRSALRPRVRPEFHQCELDKQQFENLPEAVKAELMNEVFLARVNIPDFNTMPKSEQIFALKTRCENFSHKEYFLRLNVQEQEKLLDITEVLAKEYPYDEVRGMQIFPSHAKKPRTDQPINTKPDKKFADNWYSAPAENTAEQNPDENSQEQPEQLPEDGPMNAQHVAQVLPSSGLLSPLTGCPPPMGCPPPTGCPPPVYPPSNQPPPQMGLLGAIPGSMYGGGIMGGPPMGGPPMNLGMRMPPPHNMMGGGGGPGPGSMYGNNGPPPRPMGMPPARGSLSSHWAQRASMAYNAGPSGMNYDQPPYY